MKAQNIYSTLLFLITLFVIQSNSFASQKHNGICEFLVSNDDNVYRSAGTTFMTMKMNETWESRGNLNLNERYMVAPTHLEMDENAIRQIVIGKDFKPTSNAVYNAIRAGSFKYLKARCGNIEFKLIPDRVASKPIRQGMFTLNNESSSRVIPECERTRESILMNNSVSRLLKRGCDMSVYKIDYKSILFIDEKTTSSKNNVDASDLDKVIGFDPRLRLSEVDELKNIYFKDSKGKEIKCPVLKSLSSSIIAKCNGNEYNFMKSTIKSKKLESGALIYAENPYTNKIVYINNTPAVIGLVTRRGCEDSTKVCIIELDLLQVSYDLNESTDQQADWVSY